MNSLYGFDQANAEGSAYNARTVDFNRGVLAHNQAVTDKYNSNVSGQKGLVSGDVTKKREDEAFYGLSDGKSALGTAMGTVETGKAIYKDGITAIGSKAVGDRLSTISNVASRIVSGDTPKVNPLSMVPRNQTLGLADSTLSAGEEAANAGGKIESSGLGTGIIKAGLRGAASVAGKDISEAGLSVISEGVGKIGGEFGGLYDIGKGIDEVGQGKNFFKGESTGDKFQEAGAVADLLGTAFPPLELVGGALGLIGGISDAIDALKSDKDKRKVDAATVPPPKLQSVKVSPTFQSMGLVASAPVSAKQSITGSSSF
mgnify:FL=1